MAVFTPLLDQSVVDQCLFILFEMTFGERVITVWIRCKIAKLFEVQAKDVRKLCEANDVPVISERFIANDATIFINSTSMKIYAYFLVFWSLYGIVAVLPYALKNTIYNVLDLFSKNFFGIFLSYLIVTSAHQMQ